MRGKRSTLHGVDELVPETGCRRKLHWSKGGSIILQHPQFSKHFPEGLALEPTVQSTLHWWDLAACSNTDCSQIPPSRGVQHHTAAPDPWGLATGSQKHQCRRIALLQAILIQAIESLKTGAARFLGAGQGVPNSPRYDAAFFLPVWGTEAKGRATFLALFLVILERKKSNHGPWLVIFSWKQHKPELPASLIKLWIYRGPFIYIHLKCSLPGNWLWTEIIIWKDLTLRTVHSVLNAASILHPFHRIPAWCVHHHGDSSRFYMCLLVGL